MGTACVAKAFLACSSHWKYALVSQVRQWLSKHTCGRQLQYSSIAFSPYPGHAFVQLPLGLAASLLGWEQEGCETNGHRLWRQWYRTMVCRCPWYNGIMIVGTHCSARLPHFAPDFHWFARCSCLYLQRMARARPFPSESQTVPIHAHNQESGL